MVGNLDVYRECIIQGGGTLSMGNEIQTLTRAKYMVEDWGIVGHVCVLLFGVPLLYVIFLKREV